MSDYDRLKAKYYYSECVKLHLCPKCYKPIEPDAQGCYTVHCEDCRRKRRKKQKDSDERGTKATLCWHCKHAVPVPNGEGYLYGCKWSIERKPVEGWETEKKEIKCYSAKSKSKSTLISYNVIKCPKFLEGRTDGKYRKTEENAR